jgi:hypothetical protein
MVKIGQVLFPGNRYRLLAPEAALELDSDGGIIRLTELELLEFIRHGRARDVGVFKRENGDLVEIPAYAFDPRPANGVSKLQGKIVPISPAPEKKTRKRKKNDDLQISSSTEKKRKTKLVKPSPQE